MSRAFSRLSQNEPNTVVTATLGIVLGAILGSSYVFAPAVSAAGNLPEVHFSRLNPTPYGGRATAVEIKYAYADSVWVEPVIGPLTATGRGTRTFFVAFDDTMSLRAYARNELGTVFDTQLIRPRPPRIYAFNARPEPVPPGRAVSLGPKFVGAISARIDPIVGPIGIDRYGANIFQKLYFASIESTTIFTLTVTNPVGSVSMSDTVFVAPPLIEALVVTPNEIVPGESAQIDWTIHFTDEFRLLADGFELLRSRDLPSGSVTVAPTKITDYVFEATNVGGTSRDTVRVTVNPVMINSFEADPFGSPPGYPVWLKWDIAGVGIAVLNGIGQVGLRDSVLVYPERTRTYNLVASANNYRTEKSVTVEVSYAPPDFVALSWNKDSVPGMRRNLAVGEELDVFVLALSPSLGMYAYEFGLDLPEGFVLVESTAFPESSSVSVGDQPSWVVGTGECYGESQEFVPLLRATLRYDGGSKLPTSANVRITGSTPSTFAGGEPGFYDCSQQLRPFRIFEVFDLMKSSTQVPVLSFGLQVDRVDTGVRIQWELNPPGSLEVFQLVRRRFGGGESVLVHRERDGIAPSGSWLDESAGENSATYLVRVRIDGIWTESEVREATVVAAIGTTRLLPNVPNPFNPSTEIRFELSRGGIAEVAIFDLAGRRIHEQRTGLLRAGVHSVTWDGRDRSGRPVSSGTYLVRLRAPAGIDHQRVLLLK